MTSARLAHEGGRRSAIAALLALACWLIYLTTAGGSLGTGVAVAMYEEAKAIVDRGAFDVPSTRMDEWRGPDGRYYTPFGLGQPLYDIPFLVAGRLIAGATHVRLGDADVIPKAVVALGSTVTASLCVAFTFLFAYRLSGDARASLLSALALGFGTLMWPYSKFGFNAALAACGLSAGVYGLAEGWSTRRAKVLAGGGAGLGLALLTRHELVLAAAVGLGWLAWQIRNDSRRGPLMLSASAGVIAAIGLAAFHNVVRFGTPFSSGYTPALSGAGILGLTVSPSGALLLYSPIAIAAVALVPRVRNGEPLAILAALVTLTLWAFYASLDDWLGTRSYGPRYLVPLLPLLVAPLAVWWAVATPRIRRVLAALCVASILIQIPAVLVDFSRVGIEAGQPPQTARL